MNSNVIQEHKWKLKWDAEDRIVCLLRHSFCSHLHQWFPWNNIFISTSMFQQILCQSVWYFCLGSNSGALCDAKKDKAKKGTIDNDRLNLLLLRALSDLIPICQCCIICLVIISCRRSGNNVRLMKVLILNSSTCYIIDSFRYIQSNWLLCGWMLTKSTSHIGGCVLFWTRRSK